MRSITLFVEPEEVDARRLRVGDVVFIPLIGKRLLAGHRDGAFFLDYPKRPRVVGSPAAEEGSTLVEPSESRCLGWLTLTGRWTVVGTSEFTEETVIYAAPQSQDLEEELRQLLDQLLIATNEFDAVANRNGGRPISESISEALKTLQSVEVAAKTLPKTDRASDFQDLVQTVRRAADQLVIDVKSGVPPSATRKMIGAVQAYDDDF